jgi:signal transduction histidine kinase
MIRSKLFQRFVFVSIIGVITFMIVGFFSSLFINQLLEENGFKAPRPKISLVKLSLANMSREQREEFVHDLNESERESFQLVKANEKSTCREPSCELISIDSEHSLAVVSPVRRGHRRRGPPGHGGPPHHGPPGGGKPPIKKVLMTLGVQLITMILYIIILVLLIFYFVKKRREIGEEVFEKIRQGSLDARFPVSKVDDFGTNTKLFNEMADEIMNLVLRLRKKDENRKLLFKTLAHDLKTPAASLKGIMETLTLRGEELSEEQKIELYKLSSVEIDYFSALLDDILFLAKVQDPEFQHTGGESELVSSLRELCDSISFINKNIKIEFSTNVEEQTIKLGHSSFMRLFRNALDNALLYGDTKVSVNINVSDDLTVSIINDGHGFDDKAIQNFGSMKTSRARTNNHGSLSFGLGTVIMSTIVESIDGKISPENIYSLDGKVLGAKLLIILPVH